MEDDLIKITYQWFNFFYTDELCKKTYVKLGGIDDSLHVFCRTTKRMELPKESLNSIKLVTKQEFKELLVNCEACKKNILCENRLSIRKFR